jgi:hypothetical protein
VEEEYRCLRADFRRRGRLADGYIAAMRGLFEADLPSFKGPSIEYDDVLFSPRPQAPLPIVVGGASKAALTRAATLGDGWHGIHLTVDQVRTITEALRAQRLRPGFEISLRMKVRLDGEIEGAEAGTVLAGSVESVVEGVHAYEAAGVDQLVIEPVAAGLPDLLDQLSAFAREVLPAVTQGARS